MRTRRVALVLALASVASAACGDDVPVAGPAEPTTSTTPGSAPPSTVADRGWLTGEPDWAAPSREGSGGSAYDYAMGEDAAPLAPTAEGTEAPVADTGGNSPLRAGSVDD